MKDTVRFPLFFWKIIHRFNKRMLSSYRPKSKAASRVLILTTTGRKSGLKRLTPLQYEQVEGSYYVASARGTQADWYRNLEVNHQAEVRVGEQNFITQAELVTDPGKIADHIELRLKRHSRFMGIMLRLEGLPWNYSREDLEKFAQRLAIVGLRPDIF